MQKSKFFLGATAFILAVVGSFSFKTSNKLKFNTGYTKTTGVCHTAETTDCTGFVGNPCVDGNLNALWTVGCNNQLRTSNGTE